MQLQPNIIFASRYKLIKLIGTGGYSQVWLATDTVIDKQVALKIFATGNGLDDDALKTFSKEYSIVFDLSHPYLLIPKHYDQWERMPFLVMPYMEQGSCTKLCGKINEKELAKFLVQIGSAIEYLHSRKTPIIHQDIKPDNILIDEQGNYYLTDFGISTKIRRTLTKSMGNQKTNSSGTTAYMAPEKFSENLEDKKPIKANDIFSLGITAFELLTDELACEDLGGIAINSGAKPSKLPANFSKELQFLISACLAKETWNRPTAEEIVASAKAFLEKGIWELPERIWGTPPSPKSTVKIQSDNNGIFTDKRDEKEYKWVKIGNQIWMAENLNADKFRNGDPIPQAKTKQEWKQAGKNKQPAWCYYDNKPENGKIYGKLYNWYAVNDPRGLAPEGWHVPTDKDWEKLIKFVADEMQSSEVGKFLKSKYNWKKTLLFSWKFIGTDNFNFCVLPGGIRYRYGRFGGSGYEGNWWSSTLEDNPNYVWARSLFKDSSNFFEFTTSKNDGLSIRCIRTF